MAEKTPGQIFAELLQARDNNQDTTKLEEEFKQSSSDYFKTGGVKNVQVDLSLNVKKDNENDN